MSPFGSTRTRIAPDHAIIGPDSHVTSPLANWIQTSGVVLISPAMGAAPRAPRFVQYLAKLTSRSRSELAEPGVQRLVYVLDGEVEIAGRLLGIDGFAWLPPDRPTMIRGVGDAELLVFEKRYVALAGADVPEPVIGNLAERVAEPFLGDADACLATLLPTEAGFDMAVNVFTYQSGATLPFVESHVMEHGLYMRSGQGIYRLGDDWYPVGHGDSIWMASYCPQWFVAMGNGPASYIYYKDIHRDPMIFK
ncbi:MAG TPA: (S)-ureidoglycine aminohydrolase [Planctomycetaceae bacterium]|nr:(S)-ureidoglycine aminohydrolase [Planctomycetaceae bacterium]